MAKQLQRELNNRHIQLIAIGGAIGTGLFLGSGQTISLTGPSLLFTYIHNSRFCSLYVHESYGRITVIQFRI